MRRHRLTRFDAGPDGTLGRFEQWRTLEEEDRGNARNVSSIPLGTYVCRRVDSPGFGKTFEVTGVPGRSHILFHPLNTEEDTEGCIGIGTRFGVLQVRDEDTGEPAHKLAILRSRDAFLDFLAFFDGCDEWLLEVVDY